nr:BrnA antitoxin family protein [uncultured Rhodopila sp.]
MAKQIRSANAPTKSRAVAAKSRPRTAPAKASAARQLPEASRAGWATDLVFDVREPKLAVSLRLDADVLRFFRGFGAGYQTRINEVLKAFMQARGGVDVVPHPVPAARVARSNNGVSKRAR